MHLRIQPPSRLRNQTTIIESPRIITAYNYTYAPVIIRLPSQIRAENFIIVIDHFELIIW